MELDIFAPENFYLLAGLTETINTEALPEPVNQLARHYIYTAGPDTANALALAAKLKIAGL